VVGNALNTAVPSMTLLPYRFFSMKTSSLTPPILNLLLDHRPLRTTRSQQVILEFVGQFQKRFREFPKESKNSVFQYGLQHVDGSLASGMLSDLIKVELKYISLFAASSPELRAVLIATEALFQSSMIPIDAFELFSQCCKRLREPSHAKTVFETYLRTWSSYQSHELTAKASECVLSFNPGTTSVSEIIPIARRFFATWSAVVAVEKSVPGMNHRAMQNMFWQGHEIALQLLNDSLMKPFSPVFALLDGDRREDRTIPPELVEFLVETRKLLAARKGS
jgi:hypothetical protein